MDAIAIIPARGGSKGIPGKNIKAFRGKPLVVWSIEHALKSESINRVIVSTDSPEIAEISLAAGAEVPFMRPKELAGDEVLDIPVFQHALDYLAETGDTRELIVHLRPTAPYREIDWIDSAISLLANNPSATSVRSVSEPGPHPYRMFEINSDGFLEPLMTAETKYPYLLRRQDLPPVYLYDCVIDVTRASTVAAGSMTGERMLPFILPASKVFDIDTPRDFRIAELLVGEIR